MLPKRYCREIMRVDIREHCQTKQSLLRDALAPGPLTIIAAN